MDEAASWGKAVAEGKGLSEKHADDWLLNTHKEELNGRIFGQCHGSNAEADEPGSVDARNGVMRRGM